MRLKAKTLELLEGILEETDEGSIEQARDVNNDFNTESATKSMMQLWKTQQLLTCMEDSKVKEALQNCVITHEEAKNDKEALEKGLFHGYHALRRLEDYQLC